MATTTKGGDFLGRALVNFNPGSSDAKDYLGRNISAGDKDSLGRPLADTATFPPPVWVANTAYTAGQARRIPGTKEVQTITATGTPVGPLKVSVTKNGVTRTTPNIATVNQANLQAALVALDNVDPGEVVVGGAGPWTLTWESELGNLPQIALDNTGVTGGSYAPGTTTQGSVDEQILQVVTAGTSHASNKPVAPEVGKTVTDGTVVWRRVK